MANSGITVAADIPELFNNMKLRKTHKFMVFKISNDNKRVVLDHKADPVKTTTKEEDEKSFDQLCAMLTTEPRFILYDFGFQTDTKRDVAKLAFMFWCDDNAPIKKKMIYAGTKETLKKTFNGVGIEMQLNDKGDLCYKDLSAIVESKA